MDLKINYQASRDTGNQVKYKGDEFQDLLNKIKNVNTELQSYWQGSDATKYSNAVSEQAQTMQKLADKISEIGEFLVKVGDAYEEAATSNASKIN